jgi:hypothetical protein
MLTLEHSTVTAVMPALLARDGIHVVAHTSLCLHHVCCRLCSRDEGRGGSKKLIKKASTSSALSDAQAEDTTEPARKVRPNITSNV